MDHAYDTARLDTLARDPAFAAEVRALTRDILQANAAHAHQLMPLRAYGPDRPGSLLRLDPRFTSDLAQLPTPILTRLLEVQVVSPEVSGQCSSSMTDVHAAICWSMYSSWTSCGVQ